MKYHLLSEFIHVDVSTEALRHACSDPKSSGSHSSSGANNTPIAELGFEIGYLKQLNQLNQTLPLPHDHNLIQQNSASLEDG